MNNACSAVAEEYPVLLPALSTASEGWKGKTATAKDLTYSVIHPCTLQLSKSLTGFLKHLNRIQLKCRPPPPLPHHCS
jgi:hypothetical protein